MDINKIISNNNSNNIEPNTDINDMQRPDTLGAIDLQTNMTNTNSSYILSQPIDITGPTIDTTLLAAHWTRMMAEGDDQLSTNSNNLSNRPNVNMQITSEPNNNNIPISFDNMVNMQIITNPINNFQLSLENKMQNRSDARCNINNMQMNCDNSVVMNSELRIGNYGSLGRRTRAAGMDEIEMRQRLTPSSLEAEGWSDCESNCSNNNIRERTYSDDIDGLTEATEADQYKMNPEADQTFGALNLPNRPIHTHDPNSILNNVTTHVQTSDQGLFINQDYSNRITQRQRSLNFNDITIETGYLIDNESPHSKDNCRSSQDLNYGQPLTDRSLKDKSSGTTGTFDQGISLGYDYHNLTMQSMNYHNQSSIIANNGHRWQNKLANDKSFQSQPLIQNFDLLNTHNISNTYNLHNDISSENSVDLKHQSAVNELNALEYGANSIISNDHGLAHNLNNKGSNFIQISKFVPTSKLSFSQIVSSNAQPPSYNSIGAYEPTSLPSKLNLSNAKISVNSNCAPILSSNINCVNDKVLLTLTSINGHTNTSVSDSFVSHKDMALNEETVHSLLTNAIKPNPEFSQSSRGELMNGHNKMDFHMSDDVVANFDVLSQGDVNLVTNLDPWKMGQEFNEIQIYNGKNNFPYFSKMDLSHDSLESSFNDKNKVLEINDIDIADKYNDIRNTLSPISNIPSLELRKYESLLRPIAHVGSKQEPKKFNVPNSQKFSDKYRRVNNNFDAKSSNPFNALNIDYSGRPNTAPNLRVVDNYNERISSSLSDKINKELNFYKSNMKNVDNNIFQNINDKIVHSKFKANEVRTYYDSFLGNGSVTMSSNNRYVKSKMHKPDLLRLENNDEISLINSGIINGDISACHANSVGYKYRSEENTKLFTNEKFLVNIKSLNNEKFSGCNLKDKHKQANNFEMHRQLNEDTETMGNRVLFDKLSEERLKREFCEEEIQQLQMVRLKQQQELTVIYNENKTQKETINKLNMTMENLYMESQKMNSNYESTINQYCVQFSLLDNHLKETKEKLSRSSFDLVSANQRINNLEYLITEKEKQLNDLYVKFGNLQDEYANEVNRSQTILNEKNRSIDELKIDFDKQVMLAKKRGDDLLLDERSKMQSEIRANQLKIYNLENQVKVKSDQLEECMSTNLILTGKVSDFVARNKKIQLELNFLNAEKSEMRVEIKGYHSDFKEDVHNIETKIEELKSDYQRQMNELSGRHINEMSQFKMEYEEQLKGERMLAQQSIIRMEQEFESVLTRSAIDARDLETKLNRIMSENIWLRELREKSAVQLQRLMKQHCDEALQVLYVEQFENPMQPIRINQRHQSTNDELEPFPKKDKRIKEKRKKYRLRLCVDTNALRSWIVH